ncbi:MAG: 30S ribosomal protein S5 [Chloroflexi bacterium OLB15]|nr:MAG: 30S ribosomal protein S5 [Chloroflexi bacterium OLB15]
MPGKSDNREKNDNREERQPRNRRDRGGDRDNRENRDREEREQFEERVVDIKRVAKVIKGGRRFAFRTVVVVGDANGRVGIGIGKARGVPDSIRKGTDRARRLMVKVNLSGTTIPHPVVARYGGAQVLLRPAALVLALLPAVGCVRCWKQQARATF